VVLGKGFVEPQKVRVGVEKIGLHEPAKVLPLFRGQRTTYFDDF
jgi:hypothetical protein